MDWNVPYHECEPGGLLRALFQQESYNTNEEWSTIEEMHPLTFITKARSEDQPRWHEAMNGPFRDKWWESCVTEITTLERREVWDVVPLEDWMHVIPSTFAFLFKQNPDLVIKKFKARFCACGDMQIEGVDYFETFAPVVNWHILVWLYVFITGHSTINGVRCLFCTGPLGCTLGGGALGVAAAVGTGRCCHSTARALRAKPRMRPTDSHQRRPAAAWTSAAESDRRRAAR